MQEAVKGVLEKVKVGSLPKPPSLIEVLFFFVSFFFFFLLFFLFFFCSVLLLLLLWSVLPVC